MQSYTIDITHPTYKPGITWQEQIPVNGADTLASLLDDISHDGLYGCGASVVAVTEIEPLDRGAASAGTALTISRDAAYYVATTKDGPAIRRVRLR